MYVLRVYNYLYSKENDYGISLPVNYWNLLKFNLQENQD